MVQWIAGVATLYCDDQFPGLAILFSTACKGNSHGVCEGCMWVSLQLPGCLCIK